MQTVQPTYQERERAKLLEETALVLARLDAEQMDGRLDEIAEAGDRLLREAEAAKVRVCRCAGG